MSQFSLSWPAGFQQSVQTALDSFMTNIEGRPCILYFPPLTQAIPAGQGLGGVTTDVWSVGSPMPVHSQQNYGAYADGQSLLSVETTGLVTMVVYTDPSKFNSIFPPGQRKSENLIMTRGFVSDLQSVLNCIKLRTYLEVGAAHYDFKLAGDPVMPGTIIPGRYFYSLWERI